VADRFAVAALESTDVNPFLLPAENSSALPKTPARLRLDPPPFINQETQVLEDTGVYETEEESLRAFVCPSPKSTTVPRPRTEVDLVLPPVSAFRKQGKHMHYLNIHTD
jgi:hypothetical protein